MLKTKPLIPYLLSNPYFLITMSFHNLISLLFKSRYGKAAQSRLGEESWQQ